jgi:Predicted AAA-ATPase/PD-(D/E)XK nuclease superfamily
VREQAGGELDRGGGGRDAPADVSPKIPLGINDFRELRREAYTYVDKSLFVRDIVEDGAGALLLPRPRRFGKTLNLSMLRCFFDRAASDARELFDGLALAREGDEVWRHANRYPVIAITFKDAKAGTWEDTWEVARKNIIALFEEHRTALDSRTQAPAKGAIFGRILDESGSLVDFGLSLLHLSAALHEHHGERVVILIDEYDTPIHAAYLGGYLPQALDFFRLLLGAALKDNPHLHKGVVTGILRVARENIFSGLNNLDCHSLLSRRFRAAFGFTDPEVKDLLERTGYPESADQVRSWYNGYIFGGEVVYNPWSVLSFIGREGELAPYWLNTSANDLVRELLQKHARVVQDDLETLIQGGSIERVPDENVVFSDLESDPGALWSLLLFTGYLKAARIPPPPGEQASYALSIPNLEVRQVYLQTFTGWLNRALAPHGGSLDTLLAALLAGDGGRLETLLSAFALESFSYHDLGGPRPEQFYQGLMLGLLASLVPDFEVRANRESGKGRADMILRPRRTGKPGIVLELKVARSRAALKRALDEGMAQIQEMGYAAELTSAGVAPVRCIVVAFDGKEVRVKAMDAADLARPRSPAKKKRAPSTGAPAPAKKRAAATKKRPV